MRRRLSRSRSCAIVALDLAIAGCCGGGGVRGRGGGSATARHNRIDPAEWRRRPAWQRAIENAASLFSRNL